MHKCKNCGKEFDGNFCPNCGTKVQQNSVQSASTTTAKTQKSMSAGKIFLLTIFIIVVFVAISVGIVYLAQRNDTGSSPYGSSSSGTTSGNSTPQIFSRNATNNDITIHDSTINWGNLGQDFKFTANADIKGLVITVKFYDSSNNLIDTKTKPFGNVTKGNEYTMSFSITDFSFLDNFKIDHAMFSVTSGTVSYF